MQKIAFNNITTIKMQEEVKFFVLPSDLPQIWFLQIVQQSSFCEMKERTF